MQIARVLAFLLLSKAIGSFVFPDVALAQSPLPQAQLPISLRTHSPSSLAVSSSLRAKLRLQILHLVPRLRYGNAFPQGADSLALPMAQLGEWNTALRLATQSWTRDSLFAWRAQQIALQHRYGAAIPFAQQITDPKSRADSLLLIARLAVDNGDITEAKAPLLGAMRALDTSPDTAQLAYAAWLWGQSGDREAARRVLWQKAYPRALRENEHDRKVQEQQRGKANGPVGRIGDAKHESLVFDFASQLGLVADIVERLKAEDKPELSWILLRVDNRSDFELLRNWLQRSPMVASRDLLMLALTAARIGMTQQAHELRDQANLQVQALPLEAQGERMYALTIETMLAVELGEEDELHLLQVELQKASSNNAVHGARFRPVDIPLMVARWHIIEPGEPFDEPVARFDVANTDLESAADAIIASPPEENQLTPLKALAQIYGRRHNRDRLHQIAVATVRNIQRQAEQYEENARHRQGGSWSNQPIEIAKLLREAQPGLELGILETLVAKTPPIFKPYLVFGLYQNGFGETARHAFAPLEALHREAALESAIKLARDPKQQMALGEQQISINWEDVAATQARYDAPDAPASWFGALRDDATRVRVLRAWTCAFYPQIQLKPPYVRRIRGSSSYQVGGSAGSSVG
ncbi:hypothetical protein IAD21_00262 [Abditibacteriota bacterium]|nr:hypothetical protein IAD21_00262 [Abditibacteriota bacterium]